MLGKLLTSRDGIDRYVQITWYILTNRARIFYSEKQVAYWVKIQNNLLFNYRRAAQLVSEDNDAAIPYLVASGDIAKVSETS